ncbi:hypothetical protein E4U45_006067 [Claviceps purpurea]|nr:hypothetical protein E4U45_006067 [Claviceps purpurea]
MTLPSFPLFAHLPIELRHIIWSEYLSYYDQPTVYLYSKIFFLKHLDPRCEDERYEGISRTPLVQVNTPGSLHANSDSRSATLQWARGRGIELRWQDDARRYVLARAFDPTRDVLYIPRSKVGEFFELVRNRNGNEIDLSETTAQIQHLAFTAYTTYDSRVKVGHIMTSFTSLKTLSSVYGIPPEVKYAWVWGGPKPQQQHAGNNDGTQAGEDSVTGDEEEEEDEDEDEYEEEIAAEVQPRWVFEEEPGEVVKMCIPNADFLSMWEAGEKYIFTGDLQEALMSLNVDDDVPWRDRWEDKLLVELLSVRARRCS